MQNIRNHRLVRRVISDMTGYIFAKKIRHMTLSISAWANMSELRQNEDRLLGFQALIDENQVNRATSLHLDAILQEQHGCHQGWVKAGGTPAAKALSKGLIRDRTKEQYKNCRPLQEILFQCLQRSAILTMFDFGFLTLGMVIQLISIIFKSPHFVILFYQSQKMNTICFKTLSRRQ